MTITADQLMLGLPTKIKDKEYLSTKAYVQPFLDFMSKKTDEFIINVKPADQISLTVDGDLNFDNIVYNRVNIEAVLPDDYAFDGHKRVVGFVYGLDTRKPVVKMYVGAIRSACLNLCVFNPEALSVQELNPEENINYSFLKQCLSMTDTIGVTLKKLDEVEFSKEECYEQLGRWVDNCINKKYSTGFGTVKLAESTPIDAYKNLFYNKKSEYYSENDVVSGFQIYNAFTDIVCNNKTPDLVNRFEKVHLVSQVIGVNSL